MQFIAPALLSFGRGVGDVLSLLLPAHIISLSFHQSYELLFGLCLFHTICDCVHQSELEALATHSAAVLFVAEYFFLPVLFKVRLVQNSYAVSLANLIGQFHQLLDIVKV